MKTKLFYLIILTISIFTTKAQTANDDYFCFAQFSTSHNILAKDAPSTGNTFDFNTLDIDPSTPGYQLTFGFFTVSSDGSIINVPYGSSTFQYTFTDSAGNISNVATVSCYEIGNPNAQPDDFTSNPIDSATGGYLGNVLSNDFTTAGVSLPCWANGCFSGDYIPPGTPEGIYTTSYFITQGLGSCVSGPSTATVTYAVSESLQLNIVGTYNDYNGNGIKDTGDIINYQYTVVNPYTFDLNNVLVSNIAGTISGSPIATLASNGVDSTTFSSIHIITLADILSGSVTQNATVTADDLTHNVVRTKNATTTTSLGITDFIRMNSFIDYNANNNQDSGEPQFTNGQFTYEQNNDGIIHNITSSTGTFLIYDTNPSNSYNLNFIVNPAVTATASTSATYSGVNVLAGSGINNKAFPIALTPVNDLSVNFYSVRGPVPGFIYGNLIKIVNNGNFPVSGETLTFNCDSRLTITGFSASGAYVVPSTYTSNSFSYTIPVGTPIASGDSILIYVYLQVPILGTVISGYSAFSLGDLLTNNVSVTAPSGDIFPANNSLSLTLEVRGAYDPNDITEHHGEKILFSSFSPSDYLTYTIRFENTGNGNAINIKVDNILDAKLDPSTIRMVGSSDPYTLERVGNNLSFKFAGINLPPSVDALSPIGKGYITYEIKPTAGFAIGDIIPNTASIYFDTNPAIVTNTFNTEFVTTLAVSDFDFNKTQIFPNPITNILNIQSKSIISYIEITDLNGRIIDSTAQDKTEVTLNLEKLMSGMYLLKITTDAGISVQKIIKN